MAQYDPAGNLVGTVTDALDNPLQGVEVTVDTGELGNSRTAAGPATTDENGDYTLAIESTNTSDPFGYLTFTKNGHTATDPEDPVLFTFANSSFFDGTPIDVEMTADAPTVAPRRRMSIAISNGL